MQVAIIRFPLAKEKVVKHRRVLVQRQRNQKDIEDKEGKIKFYLPSISKKRR
jgi:hypothetical protein